MKIPPCKNNTAEDRNLDHPRSFVLEDAVQVPLGVLRPVEDLPALVSQIGLAAVPGDVLEKDGLPCDIVLFSLPRLLTLGFL